MYFLGIDTRPHESRVVVYDVAQTQVISQATVQHHYEPASETGQLEQEPTTWIAAIDSAVNTCLAELGPDRSQVVGIGVSAFAEAVIIQDNEAAILRASQMPGDIRSTPHSTALSRTFRGVPGLAELGINRVTPDQCAARIAYLIKEDSDLYKNAAAVLTPQAFINFWLTGELATDLGDASATGLFDAVKKEWSEKILKAVDPALKRRLPKVAPTGTPLGVIRRDIAEAWGISSEVMVARGSGQHMCQLLGAGITAPRMLHIEMDASATIGTLIETPAADPTGAVQLRCAATDHWILAASVKNGLSALESVGKHYQISSPDFATYAGAIPPGANGLTFIPHFLGESSPFQPNSTASLHGITKENFTLSHVCRAALDGVALNIASIVEQFESVGAEMDAITLTGTAAGSRLLCQAIADACGLEVRTPEGASAALGAALNAAITLISLTGEPLSYEDLASLSLTSGHTLQADPSTHAAYQALIPSYHQLLALSPAPL